MSQSMTLDLSTLELASIPGLSSAFMTALVECGSIFDSPEDYQAASSGKVKVKVSMDVELQYIPETGQLHITSTVDVKRPTPKSRAGTGIYRGGSFFVQADPEQLALGFELDGKTPNIRSVT